MSHLDGKKGQEGSSDSHGLQDSSDSRSNTPAGPRNNESCNQLSPLSALSDLPSKSFVSVLQDDHNLSAFFRASTKMSAFPFESHAKGAPKVFEGNYRTVKLWLMKSDILFKQHNLALKLHCELLLNWTSEEEQTVIKGC
jgi:hypothetical protein